jgi:hypothetical protein
MLYVCVWGGCLHVWVDVQCIVTVFVYVANKMGRSRCETCMCRVKKVCVCVCV